MAERKMDVFIVGTFLAVLLGCASASGGAGKVYGPSGEVTYNLECRYSPQECLAEAGRLVPGDQPKFPSGWDCGRLFAWSGDLVQHSSGVSLTLPIV